MRYLKKGKRVPKKYVDLAVVKPYVVPQTFTQSLAGEISWILNRWKDDVDPPQPLEGAFLAYNAARTTWSKAARYVRRDEEFKKDVATVCFYLVKAALGIKPEPNSFWTEHGRQAAFALFKELKPYARVD